VQRNPATGIEAGIKGHDGVPKAIGQGADDFTDTDRNPSQAEARENVQETTTARPRHTEP
jgi:hypothetical protein